MIYVPIIMIKPGFNFSSRILKFYTIAKFYTVYTKLFSGGYGLRESVSQIKNHSPEVL